MNAADTREAMLTFMAARKPGTTICPSEVARAIAGDGNWRDAMPIVHAMVDSLLTEGQIQLSWKGTTMPTRSGPYRIAAAGSEKASTIPASRATPSVSLS